MTLSPAQQHLLLNLARSAIRATLAAGATGPDIPGAVAAGPHPPRSSPAPSHPDTADPFGPTPPQPPRPISPAEAAATDAALAQLAGCFVSLHEQRTHRLRGCVGRLDAHTPLAQAVDAMARAVLEDPRFTEDPVTADELSNLEIELSVLTPLTPARDPLDFDLQSDGIYLTCGHRGGCFLPQVARETGWSKEQLLARLCQEKMGLPPDTWRTPEARLEKFQVLLIGPEPF